MSARMKKLLTKKYSNLLHIVDNGVVYLIPIGVAKKYTVASHTKKKVSKDANISSEDLFAEFDFKHTKAGGLLKGLRIREGLTQEQFAKKIKVTQANLSSMENGKRPIGREIAKRIEKAFKANYRYFLE